MFISGKAAKGWSRFIVCVLISLSFPVALACWIVRTSVGCNVKPSMFKDTDWYERFCADPLSVLHNVEHTRKRKQMDDETVAFIKERTEEAGRTKKKLHLQEYAEEIEEKRKEAGDDRDAPSTSAIQRELSAMGAVYVSKPKRAMVKTPWNARYRLQFANDTVQKICSTHYYTRTLIHCDEKPFRLYDSSAGAGYMTKDRDGQWPESNKARELHEKDAARADEMYETFMDGVRMARGDNRNLPKTKQKGKYPVMAFGALGYNFKSQIYLFPAGATMIH